MEENIDYEKIPGYIQMILDDYLLRYDPNIPKLVHINLINSVCSQLLCFSRCKIQSEALNIHGVCPNHYAINFLSSGAGKDRSYKSFVYILDNVKEFKYKLLAKNKEEQMNKLIQENIMNGCSASQKIKSEKEKKELLDKAFNFNFSRGTLEGFVDTRLSMESLGVGSMHLKNSEFLDYIGGNNQYKKELFELLKDVFDHGDNEGSNVKSNRVPSIKGVPQTMFAHSSFDGFERDEKTMTELSTMLLSGYGRRCFISFNNEKSYVKKTAQEKKADMLYTKKVIPHIQELFKDVIDALEDGKRDITVSEEAEDLYLDFEIDMQEKNYYEKNKILSAQYGGMPWLCIKLAANIAVFRHPDSFEIRKKDLEQAIYIGELFMENFKSFFSRENVLDCEKIYEYIIDNQYKKDISKTMLMKCDFAPKNNNYQSRWLKENLELLEEYCFENNKILKIEQGRGISQYYSIVDIPEHQEMNGDVELKMSIHPNKEKRNVPSETRYEEIDVDFFDSHKVISTYMYMPSILKDNYRSGSNYLGGDNCILIDIDNDGKNKITMDEMKDKLGDFAYLMMPTKNHLRKKGDHEACHRFRLLFPLSQPMNFKNKGRYENIMNNIVDVIGIRDYVDIGALVDCVRFYYPSPEKAMWYYGSGNMLMNWEVFDYDSNEETTENKTEIIEKVKQYFGEPTNILDGDTTLELTKIGEKKFKEFEDHKFEEHTNSDGKLSYKPLPCKCVFKEHHSKNDKTPSAYITRNYNSKTLMYKCSNPNCKAFKPLFLK